MRFGFPLLAVLVLLPVHAEDLSGARLQSQSAKTLGLPVTWKSASGLEFALIPPGTFQMGEPGEADAPPHKVSISEPYYLAVTEMTKAQWRALTGKVHSTIFDDPETPMNFVTYRQALDVLKLLSKEIPGVRLPTEAEWEYAARTGGTDDRLESVAWFADNSDNRIHPVRGKTPNAYGLFDMQGNVWEWCADFYDKDYYRRSPASDPQGPEKSLYGYRVLRGGSALFGAEACRFGNRAFSQNSRTRLDIGLRPAFSVSDAFREQIAKTGTPSTPP